MKEVRRVGRVEVRADDPSLTAHGGLVVIGDLAEKLDLIALIDAEIAREAAREAGEGPPARLLARGAGGQLGGVPTGRWRVLRAP